MRLVNAAPAQETDAMTTTEPFASETAVGSALRRRIAAMVRQSRRDRDELRDQIDALRREHAAAVTALKDRLSRKLRTHEKNLRHLEDTLFGRDSRSGSP